MASAGEERSGPLTLGVMGRSSKENEHRLALHPEHLTRIPADLRQRIYLEHGYGDRFGVSADAFDGLVAGLRTREELIAECDVILQPKPTTSNSCGSGRCCGDGRTACRTRSSPRSPSTGG